MVETVYGKEVGAGSPSNAGKPRISQDIVAERQKQASMALGDCFYEPSHPRYAQVLAQQRADRSEQATHGGRAGCRAAGRLRFQFGSCQPLLA